MLANYIDLEQVFNLLGPQQKGIRWVIRGDRRSLKNIYVWESDTVINNPSSYEYKEEKKRFDKVWEDYISGKYKGYFYKLYWYYYIDDKRFEGGSSALGDIEVLNFGLKNGIHPYNFTSRTKIIKTIDLDQNKSQHIVTNKKAKYRINTPFLVGTYTEQLDDGTEINAPILYFIDESGLFNQIIKIAYDNNYIYDSQYKYAPSSIMNNNGNVYNISEYLAEALTNGKHIITLYYRNVGLEDGKLLSKQVEIDVSMRKTILMNFGKSEIKGTTRETGGKYSMLGKRRR
jgi:hypothetical protein